METEIHITNGQTQLLDYLGGILEKWFLVNDTHKEQASKGAIFKRILTGEQRESMSIELSMNVMGWKKEDRKVLYRIAPCQPGFNSCEYISSILAKEVREANPFVYEGNVILVINMDTVENFEFQQVLRNCLRRLESCAGVSYAFVDISLLNRYYEQAGIALHYGAKEKGAIHACQDFIGPYVRQTLKKSINMDISHEALKILKEYDRKHNTAYYYTMFVYLLQERSQTRTGAILHMHRNTLIHQINKILEITGLDLGNEKVRFHILVSYLLQEDIG